MVFTGNSAASGEFALPIIKDFFFLLVLCSFVKFIAGGAIGNAGIASTQIDSASFDGNFASNVGGALDLKSTGLAQFNNCQFTNNTAQVYITLL
jgi:hypothetical protein